jgi:hypothetical protein
VLHDHDGQLWALSEEHRRIFESVLALNQSLFSFAHYDRFQENITRGLPNEWHCRAGARFLYICEDGLVHYCSQQRGRPAIPLERYTRQDYEREFHRTKACAPYCTISCVHQTSMLDSFREKPRETLIQLLDRRKARDPGFEPPLLVRALHGMFIQSGNKARWGKLALRLLRADKPVGPGIPEA